MREIKFRAWNTDKQTMHTVTKLYAPNGVCNTMELDGEGAYGDLFPLMQFTGLHDKNGKEIYERDIVKGCPVENGEETLTVEWRDGGMRLGYYTDALAGTELEIIGNIYKNTYLLTA